MSNLCSHFVLVWGPELQGAGTLCHPRLGKEGRLGGRHLQLLETARAAPASSLESKWGPQEEVGIGLPTAPATTMPLSPFL